MLVIQPPPTPLRNQNAVPVIALFHGGRPDLSPSFSAFWGQFVVLSALVLYLGFFFIHQVYCVSDPVIGTENTVIEKKKRYTESVQLEQSTEQTGDMAEFG